LAAASVSAKTRRFAVDEHLGDPALQRTALAVHGHLVDGTLAVSSLSAHPNLQYAVGNAVGNANVL